MFRSRTFHIVALLLFLLSKEALASVVTILPADSHTLPLIKAIKAIEKEHPEVEKRVSFRVLTSSGIEERKPDRGELFVLYLMDRRTVMAAKDYVERVIEGGGRVYGVSEPYDEEYRKMGILRDPVLTAYYDYGGAENLKNMLLFLVKKELGIEVEPDAPQKMPSMGIYIRGEHRWVESVEEFLKHYRPKKGAPWVGLTLYRNYLVTEDTALVDAIIDRLEGEGLNVLPVFGWPEEEMLKRYFLENPEFRVSLIVGVSLKIGAKPSMVPVLKKIGAPVIDAISLYRKSRSEWLQSKEGLSIFERAWQVATPELAGTVQPMVVGSKQRYEDPSTGITYYRTEPIQERVEMLVKRVRAWLNLQRKPNRDKRIAIVYYNYPPGKHNIGASYLNVIESLYTIMDELGRHGYDTGNMGLTKGELSESLFRYGRNLGNWAAGELSRLVASGKAVLIPVEEYSRWFGELPERFREEVLKKWGRPEDGTIMMWKKDGKDYIVLPIIRYGNIILAPQPARGWLQDVEKLYHSAELPPHHQYIAFYLYLMKAFRADAIIHLGTHGTHEWLPGKEMGLSESDPPDVLTQHTPVIYPYIVDDVGEGLQAKRRGMAVVIDHMTPPFDRAGLNPDVRRLKELLTDYRNALALGTTSLAETMRELKELAERLGILKALSVKDVADSEVLDRIEAYIDEMGETITPFGLHTFGKAPHWDMVDRTAVAIAEAGGSSEDVDEKKALYRGLILRSATEELEQLLAALNGRYIPAGLGGDPVRTPESLPTGRNFYAFDPSKIPTEATYRKGMTMAEELIEKHLKDYGTMPQKISINLWAVETIRHRGIMEAQVMALLGVKPVWDERGRVVDVVAIPRERLGRPRVDVIMVPSGLYRDTFPNLMALLDRAITVAKRQKERDNAIRSHTMKLKEILIKQGVEERLAERLATVRIFTERSGTYGTGLSEAVAKSDSWKDERSLAELFLRRVGYLYGQGFWGEDATASGVNIFRRALSGTSMVVHSVSGNLYATMDNDDMFQYLGGLALTVRAIDGKSPKVYITNLVNPDRMRQETLKRFMTKEAQTRYLNPRWIDSMLREGYAGARFFANMMEYLWGWQVTVPEAVGDTMWQAFYETYVLDRYRLNIKQRMKEAGNLYAYQSLVARMLEAVRKGYWKADTSTVERLVREYADTVEDVGLTCCDHTCNNPKLKEFIKSVMVSVPALKDRATSFERIFKNTTTAGSTSTGEENRKSLSKEKKKPQTVEGYEMEEVKRKTETGSAPVPYLFIIGFMLFLLLIFLGYRKGGRRRL